MKNGRKPGAVQLNDEEKASFERLKEAFTKAPVLQHFNPEKSIIVETDVMQSLNLYSVVHITTILPSRELVLELYALPYLPALRNKPATHHVHTAISSTRPPKLDPARHRDLVTMT